MVLGSVVTALAAYYTFLSSLPDCGPLGNTTLGRIYWFVPLGILAAQSGAIALGARITKRSLGVTVTVIAAAAVLAGLGGIAIFGHFFGAGHCGE